MIEQLSGCKNLQSAIQLVAVHGACEVKHAIVHMSKAFLVAVSLPVGGWVKTTCTVQEDFCWQ